MRTNALFKNIRELIKESKKQVAVAVNTTLTALYWEIGKQINDEILFNNRADYDKHIVATLSRQLTAESGRGWGEKHLRHCLRFTESFPDEQIVYALRRHLNWTHFRMVMFMDDPLKREFYIEMCKLEKWSSRQLQERIAPCCTNAPLLARSPILP